MRPILIPVLAALLAPAFAPPAFAWSTAPWDSREFDAPVGLTASQLAIIAAAQAKGDAMASSQTATNGNVTNAPGSCGISLGNVVLAQNGQTQSASSNVTVNGDVINVCR